MDYTTRYTTILEKIARDMKTAKPKPATKTPDPEKMNRDRSRWAGAALMQFTDNHGEKQWQGITRAQAQELKAQNLADLIADFAHFCDREGIDYARAIVTAQNHYHEETNGKGTQLPAPPAAFAERPAATLDSRETAIILHGLRMIQEHGSGTQICTAGLCEHFADVDEMTDAEIDDLCEKINCEEIATTPRPEPTPVEIAYIAAANQTYASDEIEIDDAPDAKGNYPKVSQGEEGAFIAAWVWISKEDAGICIQCGETNADNGEGFEGLCGNCADKTICSDCDTVVDPDDQFFATPCGSFCEPHMRQHMKTCEICRNEFAK